MTNDATVADVRGRTRALFALPSDSLFYLLHAGRGLAKGWLVAGHGIRSGDTIQVLIRGLGGGGQGESRFPEGSSAHTTPEEQGWGIAEGKSYDSHGWNGPTGLYCDSLVHVMCACGKGASGRDYQGLLMSTVNDFGGVPDHQRQSVDV